MSSGMTTAAFGLSPKQQLSLTVVQCLTQVIGAGVQAFLVDRCWKIFKKRVLPIIPLIALGLVGLSAGVLLVIFKAGLSRANLAYQANPQDEFLRSALIAADRRASIALTVWAFSWFVLELGMTVITIIFLYRARTGLPAHNGIFCTVWQVLWTSVIPPFILMTVIIIDGYVTPGSPSEVSRFTVAITAKFFALSLMINLIGQGYVREKFERVRPRPSGLPSNRMISEVMFASAVISLSSPGTDHSDSGYDADSIRAGSLEAREQEGDIEKHQMPTTPPPSVESCHHPQQMPP
ncbi:unnamed protein product [Rhizoctonia solani]|nr:unnamed protein product [Rhizoctonia solani]